MRQKDKGFSLVEVLLVLTIIGILSAIAIPSFWGARSNAKYAGDARANASVIMMELATFRSDHHVFPDPAGGPYRWLKGVPPANNPLPKVSFVNGTQLDFTLTVSADRQSYVLEATDPGNSDKSIYKVNETGQLLP